MKTAFNKFEFMKSKSKKSPVEKRNYWLPLGFALLAILLFGRSVNYGFVYDDDAVVKDNRYVKSGFDGLGKIWTTTYFKGFNENINARAYRPIPLTMFAIENEFFGLNPKIHHGVNVLLFSLTAFFLFLFLRRMLREAQLSNLIIPILTTLFFVIHPIHIEVVANIKSRDELTAFLCFIISALAMLKGFDENKKYFQPLSWLFFAIALFSKESALTTLALIPAILYFFRKISLKNILIKTLPYLGIAILYLVIRSSIVGGINEGVKLSYLDNSLLAAADFSERVASNIYVLGIYFFKNLFPHPLLSDYSFNTIPNVGWSDYRVWLSIILYVGLIGGAIYGFLKKKIFGFAILWFFITVSIFSSVIVTNVNAYADRFNYSPSLGICLLLAWMISIIFPRQNILSTRTSSGVVALISIITVLGIYKTSTHLPVWENRNTLFAHDVKAAPNNARMLKNHGGSLAIAAMYEKDKNKQSQLANEAIRYLSKALAIYPRLSTGQVHLGNMYGLLGQLDNAESAYRSALEIDSKSYTGQTNLAGIFYRKGNYQEAFDLMSKVNPQLYSKNDFYLLSLLYGKFGDSAKAAEYRKRSGR